MRHWMLDLETGGTRADSVVLQVGAACFVQRDDFTLDIVDTVSATLEATTQRVRGRSLSIDTMFWWLEQKQAARSAVLGATQEDTEVVLGRFKLEVEPDDRVWGNGASFDNAIFESLYQSYNIKAPWQFYNNRCFRTMKSCFPLATKPAFVGAPHIALDDAAHQVAHLSEICRAYKITLS